MRLIAVERSEDHCIGAGMWILTRRVLEDVLDSNRGERSSSLQMCELAGVRDRVGEYSDKKGCRGSESC